jgi:hypothetical protein
MVVEALGLLLLWRSALFHGLHVRIASAEDRGRRHGREFGYDDSARVGSRIMQCLSEEYFGEVRFLLVVRMDFSIRCLLLPLPGNRYR